MFNAVSQTIIFIDNPGRCNIYIVYPELISFNKHLFIRSIYDNRYGIRNIHGCLYRAAVGTRKTVLAAPLESTPQTALRNRKIHIFVFQT